MTDTISPVASRTVDDVIADVASISPTPGGGAVAGVVAALASALTAMAARYTKPVDPPEVHTTITRADELRGRALELADEDARAFQSYIRASQQSPATDPQARRAALARALDECGQIPFELTGLAREIAESAAVRRVDSPSTPPQNQDTNP